MELLIAVGLFGLVFGVIYFAMASRSPISEEAIQRRLDTIAVQPRQARSFRLYDTAEESFWERVAKFFLGDKEMPEVFTRASRRLHQAGFRGARAVRVYWGLRIFLCLAFGFGGLIVSVTSGARMSDLFLLSGAGAVMGFMLPFLTVWRKARARVLEMRETLPDTLDLLVVCVEAGMGIDSALNRVAREQNQQGLAIGDELILATQEMQAGAVRKEALIRLADRCGVEEFRALVTFLTQTEEMGGSIARSLRVYADTMRDKRSQAAEEAARKTVIKLIFPLVFFILPAIFILILGPPGLQIMKTLSTPMESSPATR
jgi:tight adherence protein C